MYISKICKSVELVLILLGVIANIINAQKNEYPVYWNVPTFQCKEYGVNFTNLDRYGIIQNADDKFKGDKITILYDPGDYPAIIDGVYRNGGVPQKGNLEKHLKMFTRDIEKAIPDPNFEGLGIIDFEHWRPIFRQNWASLDIYKKVSIQIEENKHPHLNRSMIERQARENFEKPAFHYMNDTLALAIKLRPKAKWGYYAFPYCFNFSPKNLKKDCSDEVKLENDRSTWMYKTGTAVYPSVYLRQKSLSDAKRAKFVEYRILEGKRIASKGRNKLHLISYTRFKYTDTLGYLSKEDMKNSILESKNAGADGVIIWGASKDVNTEKKCNQLLDYLEKVIGPILHNIPDSNKHNNVIV